MASAGDYYEMLRERGESRANAALVVLSVIIALGLAK